MTGFVDVADGQVAVDEHVAVLDAHAGRDEVDRGVGLDVEEVGRAKVLVAALILRVERGGVDMRLDLGLERVLGSDECRALDPEVPRTFEIIMWRTLKPTSLWLGSSTHVPAR